MMMKKSTLLFFVIFGASMCQGYEEGLTIECAKKYLKDRKIDEDMLSYVNPYVGSLTDCESAVKVKLASISSNLRNKLGANRVQRPFVECVMRDIEEEYDESYELLALRQTSVELISSWRFWSYWSKGSRVDELKAAAEKIVDKSLLKCKGHREFGELFTNIQEDVVKWERSGEEEYCIRNYLTNSTVSLLNPLFYDFRDNPKNVRTHYLQCEPIVESVINRIYNEIKESSKTSNCALDVYRDNNYASQILKAEVLSKLSLSKSDRSREKQDFINAMVSITYDTLKC